MFRFQCAFGYLCRIFGLYFRFLSYHCCHFCIGHCFSQIFFDSFLFGNISCNNYYSLYFSIPIFINRSVEQYIDQLPIFMAKCEWKIGYRSFCKYLLINFTRFLWFCKIIQKVGTFYFFARNACNIYRCFIYVGYLAFNIDSNQRIKTCFDETSRILRCQF